MTYHTFNMLTQIANIPKNMGQYDRARVLGCKPVDGVLVVLSSNQLIMAMFVHHMGDVCVYHLLNKSDNIYLI